MIHPHYLSGSLLVPHPWRYCIKRIKKKIFYRSWKWGIPFSCFGSQCCYKIKKSQSFYCQQFWESTCCGGERERGRDRCMDHSTFSNSLRIKWVADSKRRKMSQTNLEGLPGTPSHRRVIGGRVAGSKLEKSWRFWVQNQLGAVVARESYFKHLCMYNWPYG